MADNFKEQRFQFRSPDREKLDVIIRARSGDISDTAGYLIGIIQVGKSDDNRHYLEFENIHRIDMNRDESFSAVEDYAKDLILIDNWHGESDRKRLSWAEMK